MPLSHAESTASRASSWRPRISSSVIAPSDINRALRAGIEPCTPMAGEVQDLVTAQRFRDRGRVRPRPRARARPETRKRCIPLRIRKGQRFDVVAGRVCHAEEAEPSARRAWLAQGTRVGGDAERQLVARATPGLRGIDRRVQRQQAEHSVRYQNRGASPGERQGLDDMFDDRFPEPDLHAHELVAPRGRRATSSQPAYAAE